MFPVNVVPPGTKRDLLNTSGQVGALEECTQEEAQVQARLLRACRVILKYETWLDICPVEDVLRDTTVLFVDTAKAHQGRLAFDEFMSRTTWVRDKVITYHPGQFGGNNQRGSMRRWRMCGTGFHGFFLPSL